MSLNRTTISDAGEDLALEVNRVPLKYNIQLHTEN